MIDFHIAITILLLFTFMVVIFFISLSRLTFSHPKIFFLYQFVLTLDLKNPGFDFSGAEFSGQAPDPRTFMGGIS